MQPRISFNAGEFSPDLAARSDLEYYFKACATLENWDISQMGGIRRRKGMRYFAPAIDSNSRLIPYIYSYAEGLGLRFLIEVNEEKINVWSEYGELVKSFKSGMNISFKLDCEHLRYRQINAMLVLTCQTNAPLVLENKDGATWTLKEFEFKHFPWRYDYEEREYPIQLSYVNGVYKVDFNSKEQESEKTSISKDILRASFWLDEQEAYQPGLELYSGVIASDTVPSSATVGQRFAVKSELKTKYFTCTNEFIKADNYAVGLDLPSNYPSFFQESNRVPSSSAVYTGLAQYWEKNSSATSIVKGITIGIQYGYWEYWYCVKDFTKGTGDNFEDYPQYFVRGLPIGNALTCKGAWSFYCSGLWFGSYEVRRNYEKDTIDDSWESRGISWSYNEAAANKVLSGSETDEECYLRLFITRSRYIDSDFSHGFPPDSSNNKLIVQPYKHDLLLKSLVVNDEVRYSNVNKVEPPPVAERSVKDWSWCSFNSRYGYPLICEVFNKRLVFAATKEQPQTVWFSRVDDIDNFLSGKEDDAAISLTLLTTTQNPICWLKPRGNRIMLGTSEAEYIISSLQASAFTSKNAVAVDHGYIGSEPIAVLGMNDKMLYVERGGGRVWTFEYSLEIDGWRSTDVSIFAPHIAPEHHGFMRASMIRKPDSVAMYVMGDGQLALCTYNALHEVKAWHRWVTDGLIKEVCGLPHGTQNDRVFLVVERDGVAYIEVVDDESDYTDSGREYVSSLKTLPLVSPDQELIHKNHHPIITAFIGEPFLLKSDNIQISTDGKNWFNPEKLDGEIIRDWYRFVAPRGWEFMQFVCIRVKGNQAFNLLALQA